MLKHPYYEPTNEFIQRHCLHIDEAEIWAEMADHENPYKSQKGLAYSKESGYMMLWRRYGDGVSKEVLFSGYLPNEAALESVIEWTQWNK